MGLISTRRATASPKLLRPLTPEVTVFDLRHFLPQYQKSRRRRNTITVGFGVGWIVLWLTVIQHPQPRLPSLPAALLLSCGLGLGCFMILIGFVADRFQGIPVSLGLNQSGLTIYYERKAAESYKWANASSWFRLVDLRGYYALPDPPLLQRPIPAPPSMFYLWVMSGLGRVAYLPEPAFATILSAAKEAGVAIESYTSNGGRSVPPAGSSVFYVRKP